MSFIEISADNEKFFVSEHTLKNNPGFIISRIINGEVKLDTSSCNTCYLIEMIDNKKFRIDISSDVLKSIIQKLRGETDSNYTETINEQLFKSVEKNRQLIHNGGSNLSITTTNPNTNIVGQEKSSIFKKPEQQQTRLNSEEKDYVDFSVADKYDSTNTFKNFLNGMNDMSTNLSDTILNSDKNDFFMISNQSTTNGPKGQHIFRSRKIELDTFECK